MKDLVLYCKSYRRDFLRLKRLLLSINKFNVDQIPFYVSTPREDKSFLEQILAGESYIWIADEEIIVANPRASFEQYQIMPGGLSQQIIKSEFWRLGLAENYLCLDSDSIFIKDFKVSDFLTTDGIPYTISHQNKELFQMATNRGYYRVERDLRIEAERVKILFNRVGPHFFCAPSPFNWSSKVWESLDLEYLQPKNITIWDLITPEYPESLIYGEALMKFRAIPLIAIEPIFRAYHYEWQYFLMRRLGETEEKLKNNYLGVIYQSAWELDINFDMRSKSTVSRALKRLKSFFRFIESKF